MANQQDTSWAKVFGRTMTLVAVLLVAIVIQTLLILRYPYPLIELKTERITVQEQPQQTAEPKSESVEVDYFDRAYDVESLGDSKHDELIKYGHELIVHTYAYIGPESPDRNKRYSGSNMACQNCHLEAGTKKYAAPYIGITARYPKYMPREDRVQTIEERVNGCMERSMNGKKMPLESEEMHAMVAYMHWLSEGVPTGKELEGAGFIDMELPKRAVDLAQGEKVYTEKCVSCHQPDGQGMRNNSNPASGYAFPPLWGEGSYNHGAGMNRVITAARFIKANMPLGASEEHPLLTDEEAYDVAGYVDSQSRPKKAGVKKDYPELKRKPVSSPYEPWADSFSAEQHKYGPFQPIIAYYQEQHGINKTK